MKVCLISRMLSDVINCNAAGEAFAAVETANSGSSKGHRAARDETDDTTMLDSPTRSRRPIIQSRHAGSYGAKNRVLVPSQASL